MFRHLDGQGQELHDDLGQVRRTVQLQRFLKLLRDGRSADHVEALTLATMARQIIQVACTIP